MEKRMIRSHQRTLFNSVDDSDSDRLLEGVRNVFYLQFYWVFEWKFEENNSSDSSE